MDDDSWEEQIVWVNPEQLFIEENVDFNDRSTENRQDLVRLVSIDMIQQYARLMNDLSSESELAKLKFKDRIPVGIYVFTLMGSSPVDPDRVCEILIYDSNRSAHESLINSLQSLIDSHKAELGGHQLEPNVLSTLTREAEDAFFIGIDRLPGYRHQDLTDIIEYFFIYGTAPKFLEFDQRSKYDIDRLAREIFKDGLGGQGKVDFQNQQWEDNKAGWQVLFGHENKRYFVKELNLALQRLEYPDLFSQPARAPEIEYVREDLSRFTMQQLRETHPTHYYELREEVYKRQQKDGYYRCAGTVRKSKNRFDFEIDHIKPFSNGGLTVLDNLQLLWRQENRLKGTKEH